MRYENYISNVQHYSYRDFRELYGQVKYGLQGYGCIAEDNDDKHSVEAYHDLIIQAYECAKSLLGEIHLEDDEYGTLLYTDYCRSYRQAASRFLEKMELIMHCTIDFVIYDGEINSVCFRGFNPVGFYTYSDWKSLDSDGESSESLEDEEDDEMIYLNTNPEDLPF